MRKPWIGKTLLVLAALVCGAAVWVWYHWDPSELRDEIAAKVAAMDIGRSLKGPALVAQGDADAPFVCVVAWDPFDRLAVETLRDALKLAKGQGNVRVVVLPVREPGPVLDVGPIALVLLKDGVLWPWLADQAGARDERDFRDQWTRRLGRDRWSVVLDEAADRDTAQAARALRRMAEGLALQPGDALVNGTRFSPGRPGSAPLRLGDVWRRETERMGGLVRKHGDRASQVQPAAVKEAGLGEPTATRYLQWIVRMRRVKQT